MSETLKEYQFVEYAEVEGTTIHQICCLYAHDLEQARDMVFADECGASGWMGDDGDDWEGPEPDPDTITTKLLQISEPNLPARDREEGEPDGL